MEGVDLVTGQWSLATEDMRSGETKGGREDGKRGGWPCTSVILIIMRKYKTNVALYCELLKQVPFLKEELDRGMDG
jgi:hypothetical protein